MNIDIDAGNSRIKWRAMSDGNRVDRGIVDSTEELLAEFAGLSRLGFEPGATPFRVRVASVRSEEWLSGFSARLREEWSVPVEVARSSARAAGVVNAYREPDTLGVDRWLAMLAARARSTGLCVVIDCGTAITLDIVEADGRHRGGYIVPGLALQQRALTGTARIRLGDEVPRGEGRAEPGRSTAEAVHNGSLAMVGGWIAKDEVVRQAGAEQGLFVSGGDADRLIPALHRAGLSVRREPDLVLDGLGLAVP